MKSRNQPSRRAARATPEVSAPELKRLLYSYAEAAELLSVSPHSIGRMVAEGKLEAIYLNRSLPRVTADSILHHLNDAPRRRRRKPGIKKPRGGPPLITASTWRGN